MGRLKGLPGCCVLAAIALILALTVVPSVSQAETLGFSPITGCIIPTSFELYWQPPVPAYDPARATQLLAMQQLVNDKAMSAPIWPLAFLNGVGSWVQESGLGLIPGHAYSAPYEDLRVKK